MVKQNGNRLENCRKGQFSGFFSLQKAIIVASIAIVAILFYTVFNSQPFFKAKCQASIELFCQDYRLSRTEGGSQLALKSNMGGEIMITGITIGSDAGRFQCAAAKSPLPKFMSPGETYTHSFSGAFPDNGCTGLGSLKPGTMLKGPMIITYKNLRTNVFYTIKGAIAASLAE
ncbi:hypothetical protein HYU17_05890 [Candidatus Woesearchaeota archaeon]|nr:hypothetical protein [Candidatus Woesearchaeota archaeon]